jgi:hypothetical protein
MSSVVQRPVIAGKGRDIAGRLAYEWEGYCWEAGARTGGILLGGWWENGRDAGAVLVSEWEGCWCGAGV